ncbi:MAG: thiamine phosphate synthase [Methanobrevibacter ruminantium]|uniref:thiamine phosphate synthase n=1 Tax=Methanobrevibacter ruminantium TaxID=83816 RepID=UPI0026F2E97D|nr:thiamine phosphate synthase [Methanobrevibacter ruminantium]MCI5737464.1 thiamine phosphate synthase [Methanobrevibacter ruminantium]MDD6048460.1 thiamine phosphate synthase [Methanobrevibacter ruminantium]MDO5842187.1 thiamine phosphate synthase [Methanobrevibacter ruminantium]
MKKEDIDYSVYLVTDRRDKTDEEFLNIIEEAIKGGTTIVQLREKTASTKEFYDLALRVKEITSRYGVPLLINDRIDIALAVDSEGVHIGQDDMPADIAREIIGEDKILGISASTVEEAKKAEKDSADYIGSGAVFPTATKDDADSVSKDELKEIVDSIDIPIVAIGGITVENASTLKDSGIDGFSVVSAIMSADDPRDASRKLKEIYFS